MMDGYKTGKAPQNKKQKLTKALIILLIIFASVAVVTIALSVINNILKTRREENLKSENRTPSYIFYPADYSYDIDSDEEYKQKSKLIFFKDCEVTTTEIAFFSDEALFLVDVMNDIINGDAESYYSRFSSEYLKKYSGNDEVIHDSFTKQMLYDIEFEVLSIQEDKKQTVVDIKVGYRILKNTGTFRNDIDEGGSRPVVYTLITDAKSIVISNVILYNEYAAGVSG